MNTSQSKPVLRYPTVAQPRLNEIAKGLGGFVVAVIGDLCLDVYLTIDRSASESSVETGLVTEPVREHRYSPGGAGNVVTNLLALGAKTIYPIGVLGDDPFGRELRRFLSDPRIDCKGLISQSDQWATPSYIKPCTNGQEGNRIDLGNFNQLSAASEAAILANLDSIFDNVSVVLINHQTMGSIHNSESFRIGLKNAMDRHPKVTFIVDSRGYHAFYPKAIHKLNERELFKSLGVSISSEASVPLDYLVEHAIQLCVRWESPLVITRGERGCIVVLDGEVWQICGLRLSGSLDPVGAGDTFAATVMACLSTGNDIVFAALVANIAAAVAVKKLLQTGTSTPEEIVELAAQADYIHHPELAESTDHARYLNGSEIEIVNEVPTRLDIRYAVFDHDGTISTLREGWEQLLEPMMIRAILGFEVVTGDSPALQTVRYRVKEHIMQTTGTQTIEQMSGLQQLVREFGLVPEDRILTPEEYKEIFNKDLLNLVDRRVVKIATGALSIEDFTIKGVVPFLRALQKAGVQLYLASGTDVADVRREAEQLGYADLFGNNIYGSVGDVHKDPKRMVMDRILQENGRAVEQLVVFGDGPAEIREARKRGAYAVGIASDEARRFGLSADKRARLIRSGADAIVSDFSQLQELWKLLRLAPPDDAKPFHAQLDRSKLVMNSLSVRQNRVDIARDAVSIKTVPNQISPVASELLTECADKIRSARSAGRPVVLAFGAHTIKNGLAPVLIELMERGWVTLLATNGAGIIHDWEFAFQGLSSEDVKTNTSEGKFGIWEETGFFLNLALIVGAYEGLGYGESIGKMISRNGLDIPSQSQLLSVIHNSVQQQPEMASAGTDLLAAIKMRNIEPGFYPIPHPFAQYSAQAAAFRLKVPFTAHPMIGHDIIYTHPINNGAAIGRTALRDFLTFAEQIHQIDGGVYLSVGSAVMSPMIFEKSLSMSQNLKLQEHHKITNHHIVVVDLAEGGWDWLKQGEPPADSSAYYLRYCKTFSRMGGTVRYVSAHNRDFLLTLLQQLER